MSSEFLGLKDKFYLLIKYKPRIYVLAELYYYDSYYYKVAIFEYNYEKELVKYKLYMEFSDVAISVVLNNVNFVKEIINCFKEFVEGSNLRFVDDWEKLRDCVITLAEKFKEYILSFKEAIEVL